MCMSLRGLDVSRSYAIGRCRRRASRSQATSEPRHNGPRAAAGSDDLFYNGERPFVELICLVVHGPVSPFDGSIAADPRAFSREADCHNDGGDYHVT